MKLIMRSIISASMFLATAAIADDSIAIVEKAIGKLLPGAAVDSIADSAIKDIYEIVIAGQVAYITADGKYLLQGSIYDIDTRTDLTEQTKGSMRKKLVAGIDQGSQINFTPEEVAHSVTVFTDIDCGYCRKLHDDMGKYLDNGIAVNYMFFPRAGIGSASYNKAVSVWCADDQQQAMTAAKSGQEPEPKNCENPVTSQYNLGRSLGVSGTPAILASDGTLIPGYMPAESLLARLDSLKKPSVSKAGK